MSVRFPRGLCRVSCSNSNKLHKKEESTAKHAPAKYKAINETNNKILQQIAPLLSDLQNQCNSCWPFLTRHFWSFSDDQSVFFFSPKAIKSQRVVQHHHRQDNRPLTFLLKNTQLELLEQIVQHLSLSRSLQSYAPSLKPRFKSFYINYNHCSSQQQITFFIHSENSERINITNNTWAKWVFLPFE